MKLARSNSFPLLVMFAAVTGCLADELPSHSGRVAGVRTYREPVDPVYETLAVTWPRSGSLEWDKDEDARSLLAVVDREIVNRPDDPGPRLLRSRALTRLKRVAEARAARDEAIRLAHNWPGGQDMLPALYEEHANSCLAEGDIPASAASFLAMFDLSLDAAGRYFFFAQAAGEPRESPQFAPGPGSTFPDAARLKEQWGPLAKFFQDHAGPTDAASLRRIAEQLRVGMDYREVARLAGFPGIGLCEWDHGVPDRDACWEYKIDEPTIRRDGDFIVAEPAGDPTVVHVVILGGRVLKVETTRGRPPEREEYPHGERQSFAYERNSIEAVAFSPDSMLIAGGDLRGGVHLREVGSGRERRTLRIPGVGEEDAQGAFHCVTFSPRGQILAAAGLYDKKARLWDVESGRLLATLEAVPGPVRMGGMECVESLAFSPDGKLLATAGYSPEVRLWDVATGQLSAVLEGHPGNATAVAFSPDGRTLASGGEDGSVVLWDVAEARPRSRIPGFVVPVSALAFTPDGRTLAVARSNGWTGEVRLRDLAAEHWRATLRQGFGSRISMAFAPDGRTLAVANGSRRVALLWDVATGIKSGVLEGHLRRVETVAFSPDGKIIATGGGDGLKIWDTPMTTPAKGGGR